MDKPITKEAALARQKKFKRILIISICIVAALLVTWLVVTLVKKAKQKKILAAEAEKKVFDNGPIKAPNADDVFKSNEGAMGTFPLDLGASGSEVKELQKGINKYHPEANLSEDGKLGALTRAAVIKYYGNNAFPVSASTLTNIMTGKSPIGFQSPSGNEENDDMPLKIGSYGNLVKSVNQMLSVLTPTFKVDPNSNQFTQDTYNALVSGLGSKYYPVTHELFVEMANKFNDKKAGVKTVEVYNPNDPFNPIKVKVAA